MLNVLQGGTKCLYANIVFIDEITNCFAKVRPQSIAFEAEVTAVAAGVSLTSSSLVTQLHYPTTQCALYHIPCLCTKWTIILRYTLQSTLFYTMCHIKLNNCESRPRWMRCRIGCIVCCPDQNMQNAKEISMFQHIVLHSCIFV